MLWVLPLSLIGHFFGVVFLFYGHWNLFFAALVFHFRYQRLPTVILMLSFVNGLHASFHYTLSQNLLDNKPVITGKISKINPFMVTMNDLTINHQRLGYSLSMSQVKTHSYTLHDTCVILKYRVKTHSRMQYPKVIPFSYSRRNLATILPLKIRCQKSKSIQDTSLSKLMHSWSKVENGSVMRAMLLGDTSALSKETRQIFSQSGLSHLMAVSGLHLGLVGAVCHFWVRQLCLLFRIRPRSILFISSLLTVTVLSFYASITGWSSSVTRSYWMLYASSFLNLMSIYIDKMTVLWVIAVGLTLYHPLYVLDLGFWLSVLCVFFLIQSTSYHQNSKWVSPILLWLYMIPVTVFLQKEISLHSVFMNAVMVPVYSSIVFPLLLLDALVTLWIGKAFITSINGTLISYTLIIMEKINQWVGVIKIVWIDDVSLWLIQGMLVFRLLGRKVIQIGSVLLVIHYGYGLYNHSLGYHKARITMFDVGHGLSVLVQTRNHALLYDLGPKYFNRSLGDEIGDSIKSMGVNNIDVWVVSHSDKDHMGGWRELMKRYPPLVSYSGNPLDVPWPSYLCENGLSWSWDGVDFKFIRSHIQSKKRNNQSCVLEISSLHQRALLTGDIEKEVEKLLLPIIRPVDLLQVPHHGSKTSSTKEFINKLRPHHAFISCGTSKSKRYYESIMKRYQKVGGHLQMTCEKGWLQYVLD